VLLCAAAQTASIVRLYPVDDTDRDVRFRGYVKKLRAAVDARKTSALHKLVDDDVFVGPGDDDKGWAQFVERWRPDDRDNSPLWDALSDLLSLGFIREHPSLYVSPYLVWRFPRELNAAAHLVVIRDNVALRRSPSVNAPAVAKLSFDIVRRLGDEQSGQDLGHWFRIETLNDKTGYVSARDVMSPAMPRAQFGLRQGRWVLTALEGSDR
jgi:hypothetical protein